MSDSGEDPSDTPPVKKFDSDAFYSNWAWAESIAPPIGKANRWYDFAYRGLEWPRRRKFWAHVPLRVREKVWCWTTILQWRQNLDQMRAWPERDRSKWLDIPSERHVSMPAIWVQEIYPISMQHDILRRLDRKGLDRTRRMVLPHTQPASVELREKLNSAPATWAIIATLLQPDAKAIGSFGAIRAPIPRKFESIQLTAHTMGTTLIIDAAFRLNPEAQGILDIAWHEERPPRMFWRGGTFHLEDGHWATMREAQRVRRSIESEANRWLQNELPGFFAGNGFRSPIATLLLVTPEGGSVADFLHEAPRDSYRAIGITDSYFTATTPDTPGIQLSQNDRENNEQTPPEHLMTLFGSTTDRELIKAWARREGVPLSAFVAHECDKALAPYRPLAALEYYLSCQQSRMTDFRRRIAKRNLGRLHEMRRLYRELATASLDIDAVTQDVDRDWSNIGYPNLSWEYKFDAGAERPINAYEAILDRITMDAKRLRETEHEYRALVTTASSISATIGNLRIAFIAAIIALVSLVVAIGVSPSVMSHIKRTARIIQSWLALL